MDFKKEFWLWAFRHKNVCMLRYMIPISPLCDPVLFQERIIYQGKCTYFLYIFCFFFLAMFYFHLPTVTLRCPISVPHSLLFWFFSNLRTLLGPPFINFKEIAFFTNPWFNSIYLVVLFTSNIQGKIECFYIYLWQPLFVLSIVL